MSSVIPINSFFTNVWINILSNLFWRELLSTITRINKYLRNLVKSNGWRNQKVILDEDDEITDWFIKNHKFVNYRIIKGISNDIFNYLTHCQKVTLFSLDGISEESLKQLSGCKKIKIYKYDSIKNCHRKYITHITFREIEFFDDCLNGFTSCRRIQFTKCDYIEVAGLSNLVNLREIKIRKCDDIEEIFKQLDHCKNLEKIEIDVYNLRISEDMIRCLERCRYAKIISRNSGFGGGIDMIIVKHQFFEIEACFLLHEEVMILSKIRYFHLCIYSILTEELYYLHQHGRMEMRYLHGGKRFQSDGKWHDIYVLVRYSSSSGCENENFEPKHKKMSLYLTYSSVDF